jgi:hypothetical protein
MYQDEFSKWMATYEDKRPRFDSNPSDKWVPVWEAPKLTQRTTDSADPDKDQREAPFYGS